MEGFIDINTTGNLQQPNRRDFQCIVEVVSKHLDRDIDVVGLIIAMKNLGIINKRQYDNLKRRFSDKGFTNFTEILSQILLILPFKQFCFILEHEGYSDISTQLRCRRFTLIYKKPPQREMLHSKRTHDYYKTLKSCIDNDSFYRDKRLQLRQFILDQDAKLVSIETISDHDRQFAMERKVAALVLLVQQTYQDNDERRLILNQAIATETNWIDNTSLEIIYHSKMALTEAQAGNVDKAEEHMVKTKDLCRSYGPCFAVTSACHDIEYTCMCLYFRNPSEEMLEKVLTAGDIGIQSLNDERQDVQHLWKRIILLFMVFSLLFIKPGFKICDISKRKGIHERLAEQILKEIKRCSDDIELRRRMILYLCLAVLNEGNDIKSAEEYAKHSWSAAEKGGCFHEIEKSNIKAYLKKVQRRRLMRKLFRFLITFVLGLGIYQLIGNFVSNDDISTFVCKVIFTSLVLICTYVGGMTYAGN